MSRWRLPSVRWPLLLLLASIGFTTLGVVEANRAIRSQRTVAEHALHDYAGFVAWSYEQHLRELFSSGTQEILGPVNHGDQMHSYPKVPGAQMLPHYLPVDMTCMCHRSPSGINPAIYFAYVLGADTLGTAVNTNTGPGKEWMLGDERIAMNNAMSTERRKPNAVGHPMTYTAAERRWINDTLTRQIRARGDKARFPIVLATHDVSPRLLVYTLMPTTWGDTLVYGAEYAREDLARVLASVMDQRDLLPETFTKGHSVREMIQLEVTDLRGDVLFTSEPVHDWALDDTTRMPPGFGSLRIRAQINPVMASSLVIGGLPRSRLPFLIGLLAVAAALSFVAMGQIRREGELARLRSDFVASISHELRTPLAQMRLYLETLKLGRFTTEDQRNWSLDNVERETTRLSHLVERVLRFSRTGRPDDDAREHVDAGSVIQQIIDEFRPLAAARGSSVALDAEPVPALLLRPAALRHIVLNLLDNAVKYGPPGQTVRVRVRRLDRDVRIEVTDEGPGIAQADHDSVWRPYERGRTAGHTAGSGLGLSIVRDVAVQHGGRAWIAGVNHPERSEGPAPGATFIVALPIATETVPSPIASDPVATSIGGHPVLN